MLKLLSFMALLLLSKSAEPEGYLTTLAGSAAGLLDGTALEARFNRPISLALSHDAAIVYVSDHHNHMIRQYVVATGQVLHMAGCASGCNGYADGVGPRAKFDLPISIALHPYHDYLLVADHRNNLVRLMNTSTGAVTTVAGDRFSRSVDGYGRYSSLNRPYGVAVDPSGKYALITDHHGHNLRRLDLVSFGLVTLAGGGSHGYKLGSGPYVYLRNPSCIAFAHNGTFALFADNNHVIYMLDMRTNVVSLFCGTPGKTGSATGHCSSATFYYPRSLAMSKDMSAVYVCDHYNNRILEINMTTRMVTHVVGNGAGHVDGPVSSAKLYRPLDIALTADEQGILIADTETNSLRLFQFAGQPPTQAPTVSPYDITGEVASFAGTTFKGYQDDSSDFATFSSPHKLVFSHDRKFAYVCDTMNHLVRAVDIAAREVFRVAGSLAAGFADGVGTRAHFNQPTHIVMHPSLNRAYIADRLNNRIRILNVTTTEVTTFVGSGSPGLWYSSGSGTSATLHNPSGIAIDSSGTFLLVTETGWHLLRKIDLMTAHVITIAGHGSPGFAVGIGTMASFNSPWGVAISSSADFALIVDTYNHMIRKVNLTSLRVSDYCGWIYEGKTRGACTTARFSFPRDIALAPDDSYAIMSDKMNHQLLIIDMIDDSVRVLSGTGAVGSLDGLRLTATLNSPNGVTILGDKVYFADEANHKLRSVEMPPLAIPTSSPTYAPTFQPTVTKHPTISPTRAPMSPPTAGTTTTLAGSGAASSIDGVGFAATMNQPYGIAFLPDHQHAMFCDNAVHTLRVVDVRTGTVVTVAGSGSRGYVNGFGRSVKFDYPEGIAVHPTDNYALVCDCYNHVIRYVNLTTYEVSTIAGKGDNAVRDAVGTDAGFSFPSGVAIHPSGRYALITDREGNRIRRIHLIYLSVSTIAGNGQSAYLDGTGVFSSFYRPQGIAISPDGTFALIADSLNNVIRWLHLSTLQVSTYCGSNTKGSENGHCDSASFNNPYDVEISEDGRSVFVVDGNTVRAINTETSVIRLLSGTGEQGNNDGLSTSAQHYSPVAMAVQGTIVLVSDFGNNQIRSINTSVPPVPTLAPTAPPTVSPTSAPASSPTLPLPTAVPTSTPTSQPTSMPITPTAIPTSTPTASPTSLPSSLPSSCPTSLPTRFPTTSPTTSHPTVFPTSCPSSHPTSVPTSTPTSQPTSMPSTPTAIPTSAPTASPTGLPSSLPSSCPTSLPSRFPTASPTTSHPTVFPTSCPSSHPTSAPTSAPTITKAPTSPPTSFPTPIPSRIPTSAPSQPTAHPTTLITHQPSLRAPTRDICPTLRRAPLNVSLLARVPDEESLEDPTGIVVAHDESYALIMDTFNHVIRKVSASLGVITTYAGTPGVSGLRDGIGGEALFSQPTHGAIHPHTSYVLIVDSANHVIRKITDYFREVSVFVGSGDSDIRDGIGLEAAFARPFGIAISSDGQTAFVTDTIGLRAINLNSLSVSTIYSPSAQFVQPMALSITPSGSTVLIADRGAHVIFAVDIATRNISSFCGQRGLKGYSLGSCSTVKLRYPSSIRLSTDGSKALVSVSGNHMILEINLTTMCANTIAGTGSAGYINGRAENAQFNSPSDAAYVGKSVVVVDQGNVVLRRVYEIEESGGNQLDGDSSNSSFRVEDAFWYVFAFMAGALLFIIVGGLLYLRKVRNNGKENSGPRGSHPEAVATHAQPVSIANDPANLQLEVIIPDNPKNGEKV